MCVRAPVCATVEHYFAPFPYEYAQRRISSQRSTVKECVGSRACLLLRELVCLCACA